MCHQRVESRVRVQSVQIGVMRQVQIDSGVRAVVHSLLQLCERLIKSADLRQHASQVVAGDGGFRLVRSEIARLNIEGLPQHGFCFGVVAQIIHRDRQIHHGAQCLKTIRTVDAKLNLQRLPL